MSGVVTLYRSRTARLLHRYQDCCGKCTESTEALVRESECSGDYAVHPDTFFVLGDMCGYCQARFRTGQPR